MWGLLEALYLKFLNLQVEGPALSLPQRSKLSHVTAILDHCFLAI